MTSQTANGNSSQRRTQVAPAANRPPTATSGSMMVLMINDDGGITIDPCTGDVAGTPSPLPPPTVVFVGGSSAGAIMAEIQFSR